jgi:hypothetical protein
LVGGDVDDSLDGGEWVGGLRGEFIRWWRGERGMLWEGEVFEGDLYVLAERRTFRGTFPSNPL